MEGRNSTTGAITCCFLGVCTSRELELKVEGECELRHFDVGIPSGVLTAVSDACPGTSVCVFLFVNVELGLKD